MGSCWLSWKCQKVSGCLLGGRGGGGWLRAAGGTMVCSKSISVLSWRCQKVSLRAHYAGVISNTAGGREKADDARLLDDSYV